MKPALEILAGIPTVVYGFFAALSVAPLFRELGSSLGLDVASESALAAGMIMGIMIIPFVSSLSDDVINAVPQSLREGSLGLGATPSETIRRVVLPAALPGIVGALLLAISRAIGETMIVVMAAGLAANLTANPLSAAELRELGVFWLEAPPMPRPLERRVLPPRPQNVFVTRLHVRYDAQSFPEDLQFQTTGDRSNFQGRYVMRHPWQGASNCEAAGRYRRELRARQDREAKTLAELTGWSLAEIRAQMKLPAAAADPLQDPSAPWWRALWPNG